MSVRSGPGMRREVCGKKEADPCLRLITSRGTQHSERHGGEGLPGGHMKVNGTIIY